MYPIQANDIIIAFGGVELDCKASRIPCRVRELSTKGDGGKSDEDRSLLTGAFEEVRLAGRQKGSSQPSPDENTDILG